MTTIILDAGHQSSGSDTGASGQGLLEQNLTLDICRRIKPLLQHNGFNVIMTRNGDYVDGPHSTLNESLQTRVDIANNAKAGLFISVHINAFDGSVSGIETHHVGSVNGMKFAKIMQYYLAQQTMLPNRGLKVSSKLYVLANTVMPAILTENGFIDNISDASKLREESFRQRIAVAHAKAVCDYYGQTYKEYIPTAPTPIPAPVIDKNAQAIALMEQAIKVLKG